VVEAVAPTISLFAQKKVVRCGPLGAGHAVKAVNNCLNVAHLALAAEGLLALAAQGVAPDVVRKNPPLSPLPLSPSPPLPCPFPLGAAVPDVAPSDPSQALAAINGASGKSLQTEVRMPVEVLSRQFDYGFQIGLMSKAKNI